MSAKSFVKVDLKDNAHSITKDGSPHPCLNCVVCGSHSPPYCCVAHFLEETDSLYQCAEAEVRDLEAKVRRLEPIW
jgi:hypothetical protein